MQNTKGVSVRVIHVHKYSYMHIYIYIHLYTYIYSCMIHPYLDMNVFILTVCLYPGYLYVCPYLSIYLYMYLYIYLYNAYLYVYLNRWWYLLVFRCSFTFVSSKHVQMMLVEYGIFVMNKRIHLTGEHVRGTREA
jgi:hypothetical protein